MQDAQIRKVFNEFCKLDKEKQLELLLHLFAALSPTLKARFTRRIFSFSTLDLTKGELEEFLSEERFAGGRSCPHCGKKHVIRNGRRTSAKDENTKYQRYLCLDCKKTFGITTNTIAASTKKDLYTWQKYMHCMVEGWTLRKSAEYCGINLKTSFAWRHKVLDTLCKIQDDIILDGIIEADGTFLPVSYKGNFSKSDFKLPRRARRRGGDQHTRGISREQVCIVTAVNRSGKSIAMVTNYGNPTTMALRYALDRRIEPGSNLCTDGRAGYKHLAKENGLKHHALVSGKVSFGIYHIQTIN